MYHTGQVRLSAEHYLAQLSSRYSYVSCTRTPYGEINLLGSLDPWQKHRWWRQKKNQHDRSLSKPDVLLRRIPWQLYAANTPLPQQLWGGWQPAWQDVLQTPPVWLTPRCVWANAWVSVPCVVPSCIQHIRFGVHLRTDLHSGHFRDSPWPSRKAEDLQGSCGPLTYQPTNDQSITANWASAHQPNNGAFVQGQPPPGRAATSKMQ